MCQVPGDIFIRQIRIKKNQNQIFKFAVLFTISTISMLSLLRAEAEWRGVGAVTNISQQDQAVMIESKTESTKDPLWIKITWYADKVFRVQAAVKSAQNSPTESLMELSKPWEKVTPRVEKKEEKTIIASKGLTIEISQSPTRLHVFDGNKEISNHRFLFSADGVRIVSDLKPTENLYGLGEKFNGVNHRGKTSTMWLKDSPGSTGDDTYAPVPLVWSASGYGIFVNSTGKIRFDLGVTESHEWTATVPSVQLDYFFIAGAPKNIVSQYTQLAGRPPLPPLWAFRPWISKNSYMNRQEVEEVTKKMLDLEIPVGAVVFEAWKSPEWHQFNQDSFPEPEKLIRDLDAKGIKTILWIVPYWSPDQKTFKEAAEKKYFAMKYDGTPFLKDAWFSGSAVVDFTNPDAAKWWKDLHRPLLEMGVAGFKTDGGEGVMPGMSFYNGKDGDEMHNIFPVLYNKTMHELMKEVADSGKGLKDGGMVWARSGFAGSQKYPAKWGGDQGAEFKYLTAVIHAGLSCGLSGIPFWGHDIGGYFGKPYKELYLRWAAYGVFSPFMQYHGVMPHEPWAFGEESTQIYKAFARLRVSLIPYTYSYAYQATQDGLPIMRQMALEYPDDPKAQIQDDVYLFGKEILVAPVHEEGAHSRKLYLPSGEWLDFWGPTRYSGGQEIIVSAPLGSIPIFVKNGSIIPRGKEGKLFASVANIGSDAYILDIVPNGQSSFPLFDGKKTILIQSKKEQKDLTVTFDDPSPRRSYLLRIFSSSPKELRINNGVVSAAPGAPEFLRLTQSWWYDADAERLYVRVPALGKMEVKVKSDKEPVMFESWSYPFEAIQGDGDIFVQVSAINAPQDQLSLIYKLKNGGNESTVKPVSVQGNKIKFQIPNQKPGYREDEIQFTVKVPNGARSAQQSIFLRPVLDMKVDIPNGDPSERTIFSEKYKKIFLTLKNNSKKNIDGQIELTGLSPSWEVRPAQQQSFAVPAESEESNGTATVPFYLVSGKDSVAGDFQVSAKLKNAENVLIEKSFLLHRPLQWKVIGPFDNANKSGFDAAYTPESYQDPESPHQGKTGSVQWKDAGTSVEPSGFLNFKSALGDMNWVCAYAFTTVASPKDQKVKILTGSDDTIAVWINGDKALSKNVYRAAKADEDETTVDLKKGVNKILVKVCQGEGDWGFYFRMTDLYGKPLANLISGQ